MPIELDQHDPVWTDPGAGIRPAWRRYAGPILAAAAVLALATLSMALYSDLRATRGPHKAPDRTVTLTAGGGGRGVGVVTTGDGKTRLEPGPARRFADVRSVIFAITAPEGDYSCSITVDGVVVDQESAARGGVALCAWTSEP